MSRTFAAAALALCVSPTLAADTYVVDKGHSETSFQVRHLMAKTRGRFTDFAGTIQVDPARPEASSVEFSVNAASIDTNNAARDKDLRAEAFLDAEKHPTITFKSTRIRPVGQDRYEATGTFSLRGVQKELTLPVTFLGFLNDPWGKPKAGFETSITLNRKDFGMVWNKALDNGGVLLGDEVFVTISIEASLQKEAATN